MTIQIHEQLPPVLAPLPGVTQSAGVHDSRTVSHSTPQLHARFPRREMQQPMRLTRGEVLFPAGEASVLDADMQEYVLNEGELLIMQDGRLVDLIEAGEWFSAWLWDDAQVVAHTDCMVSPVDHLIDHLIDQKVAQKTVYSSTAPHQPSPTERMSDFLARLTEALLEHPTCQPA